MGGVPAGGPRSGAGPHAFVADIEQPALAPEDRHHLERSLRLRPGSPMTVADGHGRWRPCRFGAALEVTGPIQEVAAPDPPITVAFAITKGDRPELVVQKLTELGVDRIVPLGAERSVVRWDADRVARNAARFRRIAREAAMQSRRVRLPRVDDVAAFAAVAQMPGAALLDVEGAPPSLRYPVVLVGPEGGWSASELGSGLPRVQLGPHVLRAETAAVAAGALLVAIRAGLVASL